MNDDDGGEVVGSIVTHFFISAKKVTIQCFDFNEMYYTYHPDSDYSIVKLKLEVSIGLLV